MTYHIRRSLVSDTEVLGRVCAQAWRETYADILPTKSLAIEGSVEYRTKVRRELYSHPTPDCANFLVETEKGEVVGFADCGPVDRLKDYAPAEIFTIYLLLSAQGQGLGKKMFLMMLKHLADRGFDKVALDGFAANERAMQFYRQMGGKEVEKLYRDYSGTSLPLAVYMWSDLKKFANS
jgi:ribosomal protein S18 acetylase RimI-like enzyme